MTFGDVCPSGWATIRRELRKEKIMNDLKTLKPETKHCVCRKCGKEWHFESAKYCGVCGERLEVSGREYLREQLELLTEVSCEKGLEISEKCALAETICHLAVQMDCALKEDEAFVPETADGPCAGETAVTNQKSDC